MDIARNGLTRRFAVDERGTAAFEVVLLIPTIVLAMLMLMALAQTAILRQKTLIAARYDAFHYRLTGESASEDAVRGAVGAPGSWSAEDVEGGDADIASKMPNPDALISQVFSALLSKLSGVGTVRSSATHQPRRTVLSRILYADSVEGRYFLPGGTWTDETCGPYLALLKRALDLGGFNVLVGY